MTIAGPKRAKRDRVFYQTFCNSKHVGKTAKIATLLQPVTGVWVTFLLSYGSYALLTLSVNPLNGHWVENSAQIFF